MHRTHTSSNSSGNGPHILHLMEYGAISSEIKRIHEQDSYEVTQVHSNGAKKTTELLGSQIKASCNRLFEFGLNAYLVREKGEKGNDGKVIFIYTGGVSAKVIEQLSSNLPH